MIDEDAAAELWLYIDNDRDLGAYKGLLPEKYQLSKKLPTSQVDREITEVLAARPRRRR